MEQIQDPFAGLIEFLESLTQPQHLWQVPVLIVALVIGAGASAAMGRHVPGDSHDPQRVRELKGIAFAAVTAVALALFGRFFGHGRPQPLLHMAIALTVALTAARVGVYVLHHVITLSVKTANLQTLFVRTVWVIFALHVTGLLDPFLDLLQDIGISLGGARISLLQVIQALLAVSFMLVAALWAGGALERRIMRAEGVDSHIRVIATKLVRGLLVFLAVVIALPLVGIDTTFLSVLGGALGVGLGFGLQKIASNYVSGFIILMDRSVRLGDVVTVEGRQGTVTRLEARCTVLSAGDGTLFMVPNETFLTQSVTNHTLQGTGVCRSLALEVSFGSNLELARSLMAEAARKQPRVLAEPAVSVAISRFTMHGVELVVYYWIRDPGLSDAGLRSDMLSAIHDAFRQNGVMLPLADAVRTVQP
jgi:small-conductance mechanosensitive channel